jgi:hypothetical protein
MKTANLTRAITVATMTLALSACASKHDHHTTPTSSSSTSKAQAVASNYKKAVSVVIASIPAIAADQKVDLLTSDGNVGALGNPKDPYDTSIPQYVSGLPKNCGQIGVSGGRGSGQQMRSDLGMATPIDLYINTACSDAAAGTAIAQHIQQVGYKTIAAGLTDQGVRVDMGKVTALNTQPVHPVNLLPVGAPSPSRMESLVPTQLTYTTSHSFTWHNLAISALVLDQIAHTEPLKAIKKNSLVAYFYPHDFAEYSSNVFKMHSLHALALTRAARVIKEFKPTTPYKLTTTFNFNGNYHFKGHFFSFKPLTKQTYFNQSIGTDGYLDQHGHSGDYKWPSNMYYVYFSNANLVYRLYMPEKVAEKFIDGRTQNGSVNTTLHAQIVFQITGFKASPDGVQTAQSNLIAHIIKVVIYHNNGKILHTYLAK